MELVKEAKREYIEMYTDAIIEAYGKSVEDGTLILDEKDTEILFIIGERIRLSLYGAYRKVNTVN
jgi:phenylpyruvate tautomerase PptA (4-oxalocrotonate tautomerase family)